MLSADEKGSRIEVSATHKNLIGKLKDEPREDMVYNFQNFQVLENDDKYRITTDYGHLSNAFNATLVTLNPNIPEANLMKERYKVHYKVYDDTGKCSIIFFDRHATELLSKSASKMKEDMQEEGRSSTIPKELDEIAGKLVIVKLKIKSHNIKHRTSSIGVTQFCADNNLIKQLSIPIKSESISAIKEASNWASGRLSRKMFVRILLCSCLISVEISGFVREQAAPKEIEIFLQENGKSLQDFLSLPTPLSRPTINVSNHLILQELNYDHVALQEESTFFFVNGYGGTGKTFLWNALTSTFHARGDIVLTVASSRIAATLLPSSRTAHSRFAIPIHVNEESMCNIKPNSPLANLIKCALVHLTLGIIAPSSN
ncbi:hypothetical protein K1719_008245 [Acacia pycnantha]|nr:hypothetical protein K1719_008245 [Acacia pycnantha]